MPRRPPGKSQTSPLPEPSHPNGPTRIVTIREWCHYWHINHPLALSWLTTEQLPGAYRSPDGSNGTWLIPLDLRPLEVPVRKTADLEVPAEKTTAYLIALDESVINLGMYHRAYEARKVCDARADLKLRWMKQEDGIWEAVSANGRYRLVTNQE